MGGLSVTRRFRPERPVAPTPRVRVTRLARMLALAHHVERLVDEGHVRGYAEVAQALGITRARLSQVVGLVLLAPEIQERILAGEIDVAPRAMRGVVGEAGWEGQAASCSAATGAPATGEAARSGTVRPTSPLP